MRDNPDQFDEFSEVKLTPLMRALLHSCATLPDGVPIPHYLLREALRPENRASMEGALSTLIRQGLLTGVALPPLKAQKVYTSAVSLTPAARRFLGSGERGEEVQSALKAALVSSVMRFEQAGEVEGLRQLEPHLRAVTLKAVTKGTEAEDILVLAAVLARCLHFTGSDPALLKPLEAALELVRNQAQ